MIFRTADGVDLYFEVAGRGDRVILTHGSWGDGNSWAGVVDRLANRCEVVTWDRRGHSRSTDSPVSGSFEQDANDLAQLAAYLGGPAHLVGTSSGASVVLIAATKHPSAARSVNVHEPDLLGLLDATVYADDLDHERSANRRVIELVEAGDHEHAAHVFVDEIAVGPGTWEAMPDAARQTFITNAPTVVDEFADVFDPSPLDLDALDAYGTSLMITRGTTSPPLLLAVAEELERRLPSARHVTLDSAGHIPYRTHPDLWCETTLTFLATRA